MNFEFKSTFKEPIYKLSKRTKRSEYAVAGILLINISSMSIVVWLYLENSIIPATYGSKPAAELWIYSFKALAVLWTITTLYAALHLTYMLFGNRPAFLFLKNLFVIQVTAIKELIRLQAIQFLLIMHLLKNREIYAQQHTRRRIPINQLTYHQYIVSTN